MTGDIGPQDPIDRMAVRLIVLAWATGMALIALSLWALLA